MLGVHGVGGSNPPVPTIQILDSILDALFQVDPMARVASESLLTRNTVIVSGELGTSASIPVEETIRERDGRNDYNPLKQEGFLHG